MSIEVITILLFGSFLLLMAAGLPLVFSLGSAAIIGTYFLWGPEALYALGIKPDWWKLEPQVSASAWAAIEAVITENDPWCRGVVLLGLDAPQDELEAAFAATAKAPVVKGFAVGRTIFADAAEKWLSGKLSDEAAIADMARRFESLTEAWLAARGRKAA